MAQSTEHPIKALIKAADRAISINDFDTVMEFYTDDAVLVIKPDLLRKNSIARGKAEIRKAFEWIAEYFNDNLTVTQGQMQILETEDTALVIMETIVETKNEDGKPTPDVRRATYVFNKTPDGKWLCAIDNSYGTTILDEFV